MACDCLLCEALRSKITTNDNGYFLEINPGSQFSELRSGNQKLRLNPTQSELIHDTDNFIRFKSGNLLVQAQNSFNQRRLLLREDLNSLAYGNLIYLNQMDDYTELRHNEAGVLLENNLRAILKYDDSRIAVYNERINVETLALEFMPQYDGRFYVEVNPVPLSGLSDEKTIFEVRSYQIKSTFTEKIGAQYFQAFSTIDQNGITIKQGEIDFTNTFLSNSFLEFTFSYVSGSSLEFNDSSLTITNLGTTSIGLTNNFNLTQIGGNLSLITDGTLTLEADSLIEEFTTITTTASNGILITNTGDGITIQNSGNDDILIENTGNGRLRLVNALDAIEIGTSSGPEVRIYAGHIRHISDQTTFDGTVIAADFTSTTHFSFAASGASLASGQLFISGGGVYIPGKLTVDGPIDPPCLILFEQEEQPHETKASEAALWVTNDEEQRGIFEDDLGIEHVYAGPINYNLVLVSNSIILPNYVPRYPIRIQIEEQSAKLNILETIQIGTAFTIGQIVILQRKNTIPITVRTNGNIRLNNNLEFTLANEHDILMLMFTGAVFVELNRSVN